MDETRLDEFLEYVSLLKGDEKGEAQLFLDRLFRAFGHRGVIEAEARLEHRIRIDDTTKFCDLIWPRRVLIEMKKRGEPLEKHFSQAKEYWDNAYQDRTEYVILCNFDEIWVYNWNLQREPLDKIPINRIKEMWGALTFLCPTPIEPIFDNNLVDLTKGVADLIAELYQKLVSRGIDRDCALRFVMQCLVALFAEDTGLFPDRYLFSRMIGDCQRGQSSYDLFPLLFQQMNSIEPSTGGRFRDVRYFNGGIFQHIDHIELKPDELELLATAKNSDWSLVQPSIFGNIFEDCLESEFRHTTGAHYTRESDIMRIIEPTILRPWRERVSSANTLTELEEINSELSRFQILDPACGSGNFLYIAYRELKHLEIDLFSKMIDNFSSVRRERLRSRISTLQFHGIDTNPLGIELAKITLSMAKKFAADEFNKFTEQHRFLDEHADPLPFDNLDENIVIADALFTEWPEVAAIIGNPPYQSKNKMIKEFGPRYVQELRARFPGVPGRADYCVYWFRKAHDRLSNGGRAGLVGTNTISQTYSRIGGLDYIVSNGGTIVEAVGSMPWSGKAAVHVSVVNWIKGDPPRGTRVLAIQQGDNHNSPWQEYHLDVIPTSLKPSTDLSTAKVLKHNRDSGTCYQGQTHGNEGFLLSREERDRLIHREPRSSEIIFPYLNAEEMIGNLDSLPIRYVIDLQPRRTITEVMAFPIVFSLLRERVLPTIENNAREEVERYKDAPKKVTARQQQLQTWWLFWRPRTELINKINEVPRYIACGQVTKRPIFEFVSRNIRPNAALIVFPLADDYSFGILQSIYHWLWFTNRCSTLKGDYRYTIESVFNTFPWPQWGQITPNESPTNSRRAPVEVALGVVRAARHFREVRRSVRSQTPMSLRDLYRSLEIPGRNPLYEAFEVLNHAVLEAYQYRLPRNLQRLEPLEMLLELNWLCYNAESDGLSIIGPGLPEFIGNDRNFFSEDCILPDL